MTGPRRVAQVVRLKDGAEEEYRRLHAAVWEDVLEQIRRSHISNYSIFLRDGLLVAYFEYAGQDLAADLAAMAQDDGPSATSDIAVRLGVNMQHQNVYRTRLIERELIAPAGHGLVDFALPYLREHLRSAAR